MALWKPTDLGSTLKGWFDGGDVASVTITGSGVSAWANKAGGTFSLSQSTDAYRPAYNGSNTITFTWGNAVGKHLLAANGLTNYDVLIVAMPYDLTAHADWRTFVLSATQNSIIVESGSNRFGTYNNGFFQAGTLTWGGAPGLAYVQVSAGNPLLFSRDGGALFDPGANPVDTTIHGIGSGGSYDQGAIDQAFGDVYEICYVPYNSSTAIKQQLEGYAAWRWNLQSLLPAGHPYKNAAPTTATLVSSAPALMVGV